MKILLNKRKLFFVNFLLNYICIFDNFVFKLINLFLLLPKKEFL